MNAPLQLSDSVNIKKRCKCVQHEKKSTDVRIISAWGPVSKRTVAKLKKKINFYSFHIQEFFCIHVKGHTQNNHEISSYEDNCISQ